VHKEKIIIEDSTGAMNVAGSGSVEGIGVGPNGEPGVKRKPKKLRSLFPMLKRKPLDNLKPRI